MKKFILKGEPNEKQILFFKSKSKYTAYGGSRGGGKSWAVRRKLVMLCFRHAGIRALIIRRTLPELRENHVKPLKEELISSGLVLYNESHKCFYFNNGSSISLGYCDSESDVLRYQGQEYDIIALDEATQLTEYQFNIFKACLRGANRFPKRIYITCNPGGDGHEWVKRLFIDREYRAGENPAEYKFIPASVYDNKVLLEKDPGYLAQLESLPIDLREPWLNGKWDIFAGQYFGEFDYSLHTTEHRQPDAESVHYIAIDYGLDMFAAVFVAVDRQGCAYIYDEIHEPELIVSEAAARLKRKIDEAGCSINSVIAPADLWNRQKDSGKSICDLFADGGIYLTRLASSRAEGWLSLKEWLKPTISGSERNMGKEIPQRNMGKEIPQRTVHMVISRRCANLIRCLPLLLRDTANLNDVSTTPHAITHITDALRYFAAFHSGRFRGGERLGDTKLLFSLTGRKK